jgi:hypothetical protein
VARWTFYQHAGNVRLSAGVVDLDLFAGSSADFDRMLAAQSKRSGE